jgi:hypothetical protein
VGPASTDESAPADAGSGFAGDGRRAIVLGVVVAPGLARDVTERITAELLDDLRDRYGSVEWRTDVAVDRLVVPPAPTTELLDAARRRLLDGDWDLAIAVTDLPLRVGRRAVPRHVSPTHGVGVVSLPALGAIHLGQRLRRTLLELVGELVGDGKGTRWGRGVLRELSNRPAGAGLLYVPAVIIGHVRLLLGMVRANQPWRLAVRLYRALVAAAAAAAFGVVTSDIWRLSAAMGWTRLAITSAVSILAIIVTVIAAHNLWERSPDPHVRDQVTLFNIATTVTVTIGILTLYIALLGIAFGGAELVISASVLSQALGRDVGTGDYAVLAWFVASLATVAGALGAGLESDEAVREAAYTVVRGDALRGESAGVAGVDSGHGPRHPP